MKKRVFISAILAVVLCFGLIVGASYALFTSESSVNIAVSSGKVNVEAKIQEIKLYSMDNEQTGLVFENGGTAEYDETTGEFKLDKVTPGDKVKFNIFVKNNSNVDIQYKITWLVSGDLKDVLVAKVDGQDLGNVSWTKWSASDEKQTKTFKMEVELPVEVSNEYQEKSARIQFKFEAVQGNGATYAIVSSQAEIQKAFSDASVKNIVLANDVTLASPDHGYTLILRGDKVLDLNGYTISNPSNIPDDGINCIFAVASGSLVIKNSGVLDNSDENSDDHNTIVYAMGGTVTIDGGEFIAGGGSSKYNNAVWAASGGHVIINDGYFYSSYDGNGEPTEFLYASGQTASSTITINGGFFEIEGDTSRMLNVMDGKQGYFYVNGGTFVNYDPSNPPYDKDRIIMGEGCTVVSETKENGDVWYTVVKSTNNQ